MLGILADYHYFTVPFYDFAFFANLLYGRFHFHFNLFLSLCSKLNRFNLFHAPGYASLVEVVYRNLNRNAVPRQNSDVIHAKLAGYVGGHDMPVRQLYFKGCIRQSLGYSTLKFDYVILWQKNPLPAVSVRNRTYLRRASSTAFSVAIRIPCPGT